MSHPIEQIINPQILTSAWKTVLAKGSKGGVDNISLAEYSNDVSLRLKELENEVISNNYFPEPYLHIFIKKKTKNEFRPLNLLTIKDKILQTAVKNFYEPIINKSFADTSYAYRPEKGHTKAIRRIKDFISRKYLWFLPVDIHDFFCSISREILIDFCKSYFKNEIILNLIKMWISVGVLYHQKYIESKVGIAQGGIISPLLSNIYLNSFDQELKNHSFVHVRYSDNILLISKTEDELAASLNFCKSYLKQNLHLELNELKSHSYNIDSGFVFCGILFFQNLCKIAPEKFESIKSKLRDTVTNSNMSDLPALLNKQLNGLNQYYSFFDTADQLTILINELEQYLSKKIESVLHNNELSKNSVENILRKIEIPFSSTINFNKSEFIRKIFGNSNIIVNSDNEIKRKISIQKRKYQKIWYSNLDLMISTSGIHLGQSGDFITLRRQGKIINQISAKNVRNLLVTAKGISISSNLIKMLSDKSIRIDFFDEIGKPYASILPSANPLLNLTKEQAEAQTNRKAVFISSDIIQAKIKNQISIIKYFIKNKNSQEKSFFTERLEKMTSLLSDIMNMDKNTELNNFRDKLLGFEGISAAYYWEMIRNLIPQNYEFDHREHRNASNIVNSMLNYSYGILYTRILSAVTLAGLNPNIGFLHRQQDKKPVLVFDIIEIFRAPVADKTVVAMLSKKMKVELKDNLLTQETKSKLTRNILFRLNKEIRYRNKVLSLNEIILEQCKEISAYLKGELKTFRPYLNKW